MGQNSQKVDDIMAGAQTVSAGDSDADMIAKLNEIALKVAEAQGKRSSQTNNSINIDADPMDELGCEGCQ
ncbi:MAG TPA: hypothetical protein VGG13_04145 [Candidatus Saccharimonadales bacterium]|jgi:hypothetical protein